MDAYDRCTNLGKKNLADGVAIDGRGRELFRAPTYYLTPAFTVTETLLSLSFCPLVLSQHVDMISRPK